MAEKSPNFTRSEAVSESIKPAAVNDQPSEIDRFGFAPYVDAISQFLTNKETQPPLTISVEGEWGSGKSSFMLQLQSQLAHKLPENDARFIWFSPWRHDKQESMWAAFALEFTRQLSQNLSLGDRWRARGRLVQKRFDWRAGIWDVIRVAGLLAAWIIVGAIVVVLLMQGVSALDLQEQTALTLNILLQSAGGVAGVGAIVVAFKRIASVVGDPFRYNLERHLQKPKYAERVTFLERFNDDFAKIVWAYAPDAKVFVFVDDLDRCEVPKAAELMQAINLLIATSPQLIFILGMDREKVAAGLAVKNESLLPYLFSGSGDKDGLDFGYEFIEKFVQVAFRLPMPTDRDIETFLDTLSGEHEDQDAVTEGTNDEQHNWNRFALEEGKDSANVRQVAKMVAPALDNNPRRLIQFINTFRLKAYVAYRTGLFNRVRDLDGNNVEPLSFWQLGKFVAIGLRWPTCLLDLDRRRDLFVEIENAPRGNGQIDDPVVQRWAAIQQLKQLVEFGTDGGGEELAKAYSLADLNVDDLLAIAPRVERSSEPESVPPSEPDKTTAKPRGPQPKAKKPKSKAAQKKKAAAKRTATGKTKRQS